MRAISISCPSCGATLRYLGGKTAFCDYCCHEFPVKDEFNSRIKRAFQLIASSNYSQATDLLEEAAAMDNEHGQMFFAMLLCDLGVNSAAKLSKVGRDFTRMPNYQRALQYLDASSKAELEQLAQMNKEYMESLNGGASSYPTPLMKEFYAVNNCLSDGSGTLVARLIYSMNEGFFTKKLLVTNHKDQIEKLISLYKQLSPEEIRNLSFFDDKAARKAFEKYEQFKVELSEIIAKEKAKKEQEEHEDEDDYDEEYDDEDYDDSDDEEYDEDDDDEEYDEDDDEEDDDDEDDDDDYVSPISIDRGTLNQYGLSPTEIRIEVYGYSQAHIENVPANLKSSGGRNVIIIKGCYTNRKDSLYNQELFPIHFKGNNRILSIISESKQGKSACNFGLNNGTTFVGNNTYSNIGSGNVYKGKNVRNNNNGLSGITICAVSSSLGGNPSGEPRVIINGTEFRGNFIYQSKPIK